MKLPDCIEDFCIACVPVGSRVTCSPPPTDTDQDVLCLVEEDLASDLYEWLDQHSWELEGDYGTLTDFDSYRKTCVVEEGVVHDSIYYKQVEFNLILTTNPNWFDCFMDATLECKAKNVMTKSGRIDVFSKHMPKKEKKSVQASVVNYIQNVMFNEPST